MAGGRSGTKRQLSKAEVRGGGIKPWKQKGGGRARAGSIRSPIWVGGGRAFAARPRDFAQKVNRKMYRAGISAILSQLAREGRLSVVDSFAVAAPKTKELTSKLKSMGLSSVLVITDNVDENLYLSSRNLHDVLVVEPGGADPVSLLKFEKTLMTKAAMAKMQEMLA
jgi:large subunit ribosomal protein L4